MKNYYICGFRLKQINNQCFIYDDNYQYISLVINNFSRPKYEIMFENEMISERCFSDQSFEKAKQIIEESIYLQLKRLERVSKLLNVWNKKYESILLLK